MKTKIKNIALLFILVFILVLPYFVFAADPLNKLELASKNTYDTDNSADEFMISELIGAGIQTFLALLGIIFIILMLYAGYTWMMATGEEDKINKAKTTITRAIIGLVITIGSYAIWALLFRYIISQE